MTADERRSTILEILCARRQETCENLAFELNVGRRTVERDIMHLSLRYPIYTVQGKGGGIFLSNDFRRNAKYLSEDQISLLKRLGKRLGGKDAETMKEIIKTFSKPEKRRT